MEPTVRFRLAVQYDGTAYHGWQAQPSERTVQGELERVLSRLFDRPGARHRLRPHRPRRPRDRPGRRGGRARALDGRASCSARMNALLPADVRMGGSTEAPRDFHPRYDATARSYVYRVGHAEPPRSPFHAALVLAAATAPRRGAPMARPPPMLVGDHSFLAFAKAGQEERGDRCIVALAEWASGPGWGWSSTSPRTGSCTTWCATSSARWSTIGLGEREMRTWRRCWERADGSRPRRPRRPAASSSAGRAIPASPRRAAARAGRFLRPPELHAMNVRALQQPAHRAVRLPRDVAHLLAGFKFGTWRRLWLALAEAERSSGSTSRRRRSPALREHLDDVDLERAAELERELRHDVMAHVHHLGEQAPEARGIIHLGATSAYVGDNTDLIQHREG
jgi:hypothetical protein